MTSTEAKWAARIREQTRSGLSMRAFCEGKPFKASTLRWWKGRLRHASISAPPGDVAVRLVRAVPVRAPASDLVIEIGVARVVVREGFDATLLRQVVAALEVPR